MFDGSGYAVVWLTLYCYVGHDVFLTFHTDVGGKFAVGALRNAPIL